MYQVTYMDKKGASIMHAFSNADKVEKFISTLRREATVRKDGEIVGGIEYRPGEWDDKRLKWFWWLEV